MFALNNKKRLRQALYANPTTDTFEDSSAAMLDSAGGGCLDASGVTIPQKRFSQLQGLNSSNKEKNAVGSSSLMQQNHKSIGSGGNIETSRLCIGRYYGTNQGGAQVRQPIKQQSYSILNNSMDSPTTNSTPSNKTARTLQHQPVKVFQGPGIKVEKQNMTKQRRPDLQDQSFQSKVEQYLVYLRFTGSLDHGFTGFLQAEKHFHLKVHQASNGVKKLCRGISAIFKYHFSK